MIHLSAHKLNIKLAVPLKISFHTWHYRENVIIKLQYNGQTGIGEAAPFKPITGDSQDEVLSDATKLTTLPFDPLTDDLSKLHAFLDQHTNCQTLKAAIDFAYHDLKAKLLNIPVWKLYSDTAVPKINSITVFIKDTPEETSKEAKRIFDTYPDLKLMKIKLTGRRGSSTSPGGNVANIPATSPGENVVHNSEMSPMTNDLDRCKAIKSVSPPHIKFLLDANQGYSDAKEAVSELSKIINILGDVILIEEPCPKGEHEKMKYVHENLKTTKVYADESAATLADAKSVIADRAAAGVNIKLQKAGGIWPSKLIAHECEKAGLQVMVGSMGDCDIATAASIHFALSTSNVLLTDLDMDLDIPRLCTTGPVFNAGMRVAVEGSGLGVELKESIL